MASPISWFRKDTRGSPKEPGQDTAQMEDQYAAPAVRNPEGDNPITADQEDALGRAPLAASFARQLMNLNARDGVVVGVLGAWGSGKTSFVNLARVHLAAAGHPVLEFNPWMFSGAEQLVESFFVELSAQLKVSKGLSHVGELLGDYGEALAGFGWLPIVGPWIERGKVTAKAIASILKRKKEGSGARRIKIQAALARIEKPIFVVVDDIDRLTTSEIRDVFKLVRLAASFPNIVYILAFDRMRVEQALGEQGIPGRDYLEKILQIGIDLPVAPASALNDQIFSALNGILGQLAHAQLLNPNLWPDVFMEVIRPLIKNMRDVRRYTAAVRGTLADLDGKIAVVDILAMEAIRVFLPDVFHKISVTSQALVDITESEYDKERSARMKEWIGEMVSSAGSNREVIRAMIMRLFPAAQRHIGRNIFGAQWKNEWLRDRRIAHEDLLSLYLERVEGESLKAFADAERAWPLMQDQELFTSYLQSLDANRIEKVIASLEAYEDRFTLQEAVASSAALLNVLPTLPARERGFLDVDARTVVKRVVYRLFKAAPTQSDAEQAVAKALPLIHLPSSKLIILEIAGHTKDVGHGFISESAAASFERAWRDQVRALDLNSAIADPEILRVYYVTNRDRTAEEPPLSVHEDPRMAEALLRSSATEILSQADGTRAVRRSPRLMWDALIAVYGGEDIFRVRLEALKVTNPQNIDDLVALAEKYLGGWRPRAFETD